MKVNMRIVECVSTYKCFAEENRLRILNLLIDGPLCVCHIQEILELPQPKVSRLLMTLRELRVVTSERHFNWIMYQLSVNPTMVLRQNLECLKLMRKEEKQLQVDLEKRGKIVAILAKEKKGCPLCL